MMNLAVLLGLLVLGNAEQSWERKTSVDFSDNDFLNKAFNDWMEYFDYDFGPIEKRLRKDQFIKNWKYIVDWNENPQGSYDMKLNQFGHLSAIEFKQYVGGKDGSCVKQMKRDKRLFATYDPSTNNPEVPTSVDWTTKGVVTPIKNQGQCGSCWSFATTGALECRYAIKTGQLNSLSEQQLVDCTRSSPYGNYGCGGGWPDKAFEYVRDNGGLCSETAYPYTATDGTCRASSCGTKYDADKAWVDVTQQSEPALQAAVAEGCVSVLIEADQSAFQFYSSGILDGNCGTSLDHAVLVVGYGTQGGQDYWKVKNSWGTSWGEEGYVLICRNCNKDNGNGECGILDSPSYPTF